jgi:hypothetical protein
MRRNRMRRNLQFAEAQWVDGAVGMGLNHLDV